VAGSTLRCKANIYNCYELGDLLLSAHAIWFKQETGTLQYNSVHSPNQRAIQAVENLKIGLCHWINTDVVADLIRVCSSRRYLHPTPIHGQLLEIPK